jgi:AhpD family alkylhydroperoxidase
VAERELIAAFVSGLNACGYCHGVHTAAARSSQILTHVAGTWALRSSSASMAQYGHPGRQYTSTPRAPAAGLTARPCPVRRLRREVVIAFQLHPAAAFSKHCPLHTAQNMIPSVIRAPLCPIAAPPAAAPVKECQPGDKMGAMSFRRLPATAAQRAARLLPVPVGIPEAAIRQAAWVARCVGRGQSAPLRPEDLTALASTLQVRPFRPGSVLFSGGKPTPGVWIVRDGRIELSVGSGRRRAVVQLLRPGDVDGDIQLLLEMPLPYTARAISEVTSLFLARQGFENLLATHPAIARRWLSSVAQRLAASQARILALLGGSLAAQTASLLDEEAVDGRVELPQRTLAAMLGVQRPSLNKVLKDMERGGLIRISYSTIEVVDRTGLAARARSGA